MPRVCFGADSDSGRPRERPIPVEISQNFTASRVRVKLREADNRRTRARRPRRIQFKLLFLMPINLRGKAPAGALISGGGRYTADMAIGKVRGLHQSAPFDSVTLSPEALDQLLDMMDCHPQTAGPTRRRHERYACRCKGLIIIDQSGYRSIFTVPIRNVSRGGIAFLHRAMIHTGTPCQLLIRTPANGWIQASGKARRSRYVQIGIYEIGLQLDEEIDPALFQTEPRREVGQRPATSRPAEGD